MGQGRQCPDGFVWDYFHDPDDLGRSRLAAMCRFFSDFEKGKAEGRYVAASLPALPFDDGQLHVALISHLLFLYAKQLPLEFTKDQIQRLSRVARAVLVF